MQLGTAGAIDAIDIPFIAARNKQLSGQAECETRCVHDVGYERSNRAFWRDFVYRYWSFLAAPAAVGGVNIAFSVKRRICNRMKIRRQLLPNFIGKGAARVAI